MSKVDAPLRSRSSVNRFAAVGVSVIRGESEDVTSVRSFIEVETERATGLAHPVLDDVRG